MLSIDSRVDARKTRQWARKFGDTSNDALVRVSVIAAREAAVNTQVKGKSKKKQVDAIIMGTRLNIVPVNARSFNKVAKSRRPSFKMSGRYVSLGQDQILRSASDVESFVERSRGKNGRVQKLPPEKRAVAKQSDLTKALVQRKKRAGQAKGSWLGAGIRASRFTKGRGEKIGKNFIAWAQKHKNLGTAKFRRRMIGKSEMLLISKARHTAKPGIFSRADGKKAVATGWRKAATWYRRESKRIDK